MKYRNPYSQKGKPWRLLFGLLAVFCLLAISACGGSGNNSSHVYDDAHVLNASSVHNAASELSYPLDVYTTRTFTGSSSDFDRRTSGHLNGDSSRIVLAIDTVHRHMYIAFGTQVPLNNSGISQAVNAFSSNFGNDDYTGATLASIKAMQQSLGSNSGSGNALSGSVLTLLCVGLLFLAILGMIFGAIRRRLFGGGNPGRVYQQPYQQPYPYNQGNYYGPNNQGGGMNPWAAGGLGAAAGGLIGYELGKEAGEHEARDRDDWGGGNFGGGDAFGGGGGGDFGGGSNFGGGDAFGGGGGGDFGGGGNFSGGGDFGGGGGGNF